MVFGVYSTQWIQVDIFSSNLGITDKDFIIGSTNQNPATITTNTITEDEN